MWLLVLVGCGSVDWCTRFNLDCETETIVLDGIEDKDGDMWSLRLELAGGCGGSSLSADPDLFPSIHPGAPEVCDGFDNDCDGEVDEGVKADYWQDADGDGFGAGAIAARCGPERDEILVTTTVPDCDDADPLVNPDAIEICDDKDTDCDGVFDDEPLKQPHYRDEDGDGFGTGVSERFCALTAPSEWSRFAGDCDDGDERSYPNAVELCLDNTDNDCDQEIDEAQCLLDQVVLFRGSSPDPDESLGYLGLSASISPDVTGDGVADAILADPINSRLYVAEGPISANRSLSSTDAIRDLDTDNFTGTSIDATGDADGDGIADVLIGAYQVMPGPNLLGGVYLLNGPLTAGMRFDADALVIVPGVKEEQGLGWLVSWVGDTNDDDHVDLLTVTPSNGLYAEISLWTRAPTAQVTTLQADARIFTNTDVQLLAVSGAPDMDGDGLDEVILGDSTYRAGEMFPGAAFIVPGPLDAVQDVDDLLWLAGSEENELTGAAVAGLRDATGDGYGDILVGAVSMDASAQANTGGAYLVAGPVTASGSIRAIAAARMVGVNNNDQAGTSVDSAGDLNDDGLSDLLVYAPQHIARSVRGAVHIVPSPVEGLVSLQDALTQSASSTLRTVATSGGEDLNGDSVADLLIGVPSPEGGGAGYGNVLFGVGGE